MFASDQEALLATIIATPDDDAPRLIYADWLDEHEQPERAEFIRLQIELARMPKWRDPPTERLYQERFRRTQELLTPEWVGHRFRVGESLAHSPAIRFRRGFPAQGLVAAAHMPSLQVDIMHHRLLRDLAISGVTTATLDRLFALPSLEHFEQLRLRSDRSTAAAHWHQLAGIPEAPNLRGLSLLGGQMLTIWDAQRIARCPRLTGVTELRLNVPHQAPMLDVLLADTAFQQLRVLHTNAEGYTPYFPNILELPRLSSLEDLSLSGYEITELIAEELVHAPFWPTLRSLAIESREVTEAAIRVLIQQEAPGLTTLRMNHDALPTTPLENPLLKHVQELEVFGGIPNDDERWLRELSESECGPKLRCLRLPPSIFDQAVIYALAQCAGFQNLNVLTLVNSRLSDACMMALVESPNLANLSTLEIRGSPLASETIIALQDRFPNVQASAPH